MQTRDFGTTILDSREKIRNRVIQGFRQKQNDERRGHARQRLDKAGAQAKQQSEQKIPKLVAQRLGQGEAGQYESQPQIRNTKSQSRHQKLCESLHQCPAMARPGKMGCRVVTFASLTQAIDEQCCSSSHEPKQGVSD